MGTLSDRILSLPKRTPGQHDVVVRAANLAKEADELMERMLAALEDCAREDADGLDAAMAKDTVTMYYEWKERTK